MTDLTGTTVAVIATDGFEDSELSSPLEAVRNAGATVEVLAPAAGKITGKNGTEVPVDRTTADAAQAEFDAIILPGGTGNADKLRMNADAVGIVRRHVEADRPLGAICHAAWTLVEADAVRGRTLTSYPSLQTDLRNAGATWVDEEVVVDGNLVSSRTPDDLPAFDAKIVEVFGRGAAG